jgi:Domain of unknown function (DUF397)
MHTESDLASLSWRKSSFSGSNGCLEAASCGNGSVAVRDSKDPHSAVLVYTAHEWRAFLQGVMNREFDDLPDL